MNEGRQRAARAAVTFLIAVTPLTAGSACEARSSVDGAQTAVALAQTALPGLQTAVPGVQATAQVGATLVAGALADPRAIALQVQTLLAGAQVDLAVEPNGTRNDAATRVTVSATDTRGTFGQLDPRARQAAASAALIVVGQYYPNAAVALNMTDAAGARLIGGTRAPGQTPAIETSQ